MKIELHMIQSFPPSCLNRDEANAPKDCVFGGARRARISSQCIKRSIRWESGFQEAMGEHLASRSLRFPEQVREALVKMKVPENKAREVAAELQKIAKKESEESEEKEKKGKKPEEFSILKTPQIVFYSKEEVEACAAVVKALLDEGKSAKEILKAVTAKNSGLFPAPKSVDIALFGRMVTSEAFANVDAACQVAHAISTHRVEMEFDFFTAVDDLQPKEDAGAGMMGTTGFNSACFYRYAVLDFDALAKNLGGDRALAKKATEAFLRASVKAVPTGKQNTFAAHTPPSFVLAAVRKQGAWNLANAFEKPVAARRDKGLVEGSIGRLDEHFGRLKAAFGDGDLLAAPVLPVDGEDELRHLDQKVRSLDGLVSAVLAAVDKIE